MRAAVGAGRVRVDGRRAAWLAERPSNEVQPGMTNGHFPTRRWALALVVAVLAAALSTPVAAGAQDPPPDLATTRAEQSDALRQRAESAAALDAEKASLDELQGALATLADAESAAAAEAGAAQEAYAAATVTADEARSAEAAKQAEVDALEAAVRRMVVKAYQGADPGGKAALLMSAEDLATAANMNAYLDSKAEHDNTLIARLADARQQLTDARMTAEDAEREASDRATATAAQVAALERARAEHQRLADDVAARVFALGAATAAADATVHQLDLQLTAMAGGRVPVGRKDLVAVRGIWVHVSVAPTLDALLTAAEADGVLLTGTGWRDAGDQVALRSVNGCPDVYTAPPEACAVPTALPGTSMHEQGRAVDFRLGDAPIDSHSNPGFAWLAANAWRYGWKNLPSEPWHWSVTGE